MQALDTKLQRDFGIAFEDKTLLETAFTHTSYANEHRLLNISHNERLEFLGDAVLQLLISQYLFKKYPKKLKADDYILALFRNVLNPQGTAQAFIKIAAASRYFIHPFVELLNLC